MVHSNMVHSNMVHSNIVPILNRYEKFEGIQNLNVGHSESGFAHSYPRVDNFYNYEKFTHISLKGYFEYDNLWKISSNFLCENKIYKNRFFKNEQTRGTQNLV